MENEKTQVESGNILVRSGLDFEVEKRPHFIKRVSNMGDTYEESGMSCGIFRTDTGDEIGDVGKSYAIAQTQEILEPFLFAAKEGFIQYKNGRTIENGRRFCLTFNVDELHEIRGEKFQNQVIVGGSHDGSWATFIKCCLMRQVCTNGLMKLANMPDQFRIKHTESWKTRYNGVLLQLEQTKAYFQKAFQNYEGLFEIRLTRENRALLTSRLLDFDPKSKDVSTRKLNQYDKIMYLSEYGTGIRGNPEILNTGAAWYNAVVEYVDHFANRDNEESQYVSANFGFGESRKARAFELLTV